jgi:hypothetical protein
LEIINGRITDIDETGLTIRAHIKTSTAPSCGNTT